MTSWTPPGPLLHAIYLVISGPCLPAVAVRRLRCSRAFAARYPACERGPSYGSSSNEPGRQYFMPRRRLRRSNQESDMPWMAGRAGPRGREYPFCIGDRVSYPGGGFEWEISTLGGKYCNAVAGFVPLNWPLSQDRLAPYEDSRRTRQMPLMTGRDGTKRCFFQCL